MHTVQKFKKNRTHPQHFIVNIIRTNIPDLVILKQILLYLVILKKIQTKTPNIILLVFQNELIKRNKVLFHFTMQSKYIIRLLLLHSLTQYHWSYVHIFWGIILWHWQTYLCLKTISFIISLQIHHIVYNLSTYLKTNNQTCLYIEMYKKRFSLI